MCIRDRLYWDGSAFVETVSGVTVDFDESTGTWVLPDVDFSVAGDYEVLVNVRDVDGNIAFTSENPQTLMSFREVDVTDPFGEATGPGDGLVGVYDVSGVATDDLSGVDRVRVQVRTVGVTPRLYWDGSAFVETVSGVTVDFDESTGTWVLPDVDFSVAGEYEVLVNVRDVDGNIAFTGENPQTQFTFEADVTDPFGEATGPGDGLVGVYDVSGIATDNTSVDRVRVQVRTVGVTPRLYWDGAEFSATPVGLPVDFDESTGTWVLPDVDFSVAGDYEVLVYVRDVHGNVSFTGENPQTLMTFREADVTDPFGEATGPGDGLVGVYDVTGVASDDLSGVDRVRVQVRTVGVTPRLYWDGSAFVETVSGVNVDFDESTGTWVLPDVDFSVAGEYEVLVNVRDVDGNVAFTGENPQTLMTFE